MKMMKKMMATLLHRKIICHQGYRWVEGHACLTISLFSLFRNMKIALAMPVRKRRKLKNLMRQETVQRFLMRICWTKMMRMATRKEVGRGGATKKIEILFIRLSSLLRTI